MSQFESNDVAVAAVAGGAAAAARSVLSEEFVNPGKHASPSDNKETSKPSDSSNPAVTLGSTIAQGIAEAVKDSGKHSSSSPAEGLGSAIKDAIKNGTINGDRSPLSGMEKGGRLIEDFGRHWDKTVTDKNRNEAKEALGKGLSELIPEADRALLKTMQGALIDGNLDKLKSTLGSLAADPEKMEKVLKEINGQLKREGAQVELSSDGKGNVLVYEKGGNTAVSINAKSGETTLRAIERQNDGSILLKPGEIINRKPAEVMKNIGDEATRDITGMNYRYHKLHYYNFPEDRLMELHHNNSSKSGGGGGGGGGGGDSSTKTSPSLSDTIKDSMKQQLENVLPEVKKKVK